MGILISGTTNDILVNGVSVATDTEVSSAVAPKANTADLKEIGVGQTWQDVTASRVAGTTYTNSTGKPIYISITTTPYSGGWINVGGTIVIRAGSSNSGIGTFYWTVQAIIPNGVTYTYSGSPTGWYELR